MEVTFWGTRGSLPRAVSHSRYIEILETLVKVAKQQGIKSLDDFLDAAKSGALRRPIVYGGNSTSTQIDVGDHTIFVDAGSGIAYAGDKALSQGRKEFHIFQTHFHWDHILGLPFFIPIYLPGHKLIIYHVHKSGEKDLRVQWNGKNFPVKWEQLSATIEFRELPLYQPVEIEGGCTVTPFALDHPGGSFGYRIEGDGKSIAIGVDGEYKRFTAKDLGKDLPFYQNLDAFVFDAQYEVEELASRYDWGHCTPPIGVDIAMREGIRNLFLTHHDPRSTEEKINSMHEQAKKYMTGKLKGEVKNAWKKLGQPDGPNIYSAYDGMQFSLDKKGVKQIA